MAAGGAILIRRRKIARSKPTCVLALICTLALADFGPSWAQNVVMTGSPEEYNLQLDNNSAFHTTSRPIQNIRSFFVENSTMLIVLWEEAQENEEIVPLYALFPDGQLPARVTETSYMLNLPLRIRDSHLFVVPTLRNK
jgi:hypothetical protein